MVNFLFIPGSDRRISAEANIPTFVEVLMSCGDGTADLLAGEVCDPGTPPIWPKDIGTSTCQNFSDIFGNPFQRGILNCNDDCFAFNLDGCYTCGNTHKEVAEECDANDFGSATCLTLGFDRGSLYCTPDCQISVINCEALAHEGGTPGGGASGGGGRSGGADSASTGFDPGADTQKVTKVVIRGKSYADSDVHILKDGVVLGIVRSDPKADFYFESSEITPGIVNFSFWSEDKGSTKSALLTLTLRIISGATTNVTGVYIAPSIDVDKKAVKQGEQIKIFGESVPNSDIQIHINSAVEHVKRTQSKEKGDWELTFDTTPLEEDFHTAKAFFEVKADTNVIKSGFSKLVSFSVNHAGGTAVCPEADLNKDSRVNLTDFSILLYNWGTDNACSDQNQNGKVDLIDFSIMMYYWTG